MSTILRLLRNDFPMQPGLQSGNEDFSSHAARARFHPCVAGPGFFTPFGGSFPPRGAGRGPADTKKIRHLRACELQTTVQANVRIDSPIGGKEPFRMETLDDKGPATGYTFQTEHRLLVKKAFSVRKHTRAQFKQKYGPGGRCGGRIAAKASFRAICIRTG